MIEKARVYFSVKQTPMVVEVGVYFSVAMVKKVGICFTVSKLQTLGICFW